MDGSYDIRWAGPLRVRHDSVMGIQVLAFEGAIERETVPEVRASLEDAVERGAPLVLDLRMVSAVDATGTEVLRMALARVTAKAMAVACVRPFERGVADLLGAVRPEGDVPFEIGVSEAIHAVSPAWRPDGPRWTPEPSVQLRPRRDRSAH